MAVGVLSFGPLVYTSPNALRFTFYALGMQALIFDMDGVIVDSELHWKSLEGYFLQSLIPGWSVADQGRIIGLSLDNLYNLLTNEYGLSRDKEGFLTEYHAIAEDIYVNKVALLPGFLDL